MNRYFDRQIGTGIRQPNPNDLNRGPQPMGEMTQQQGMGPGMGQVGYGEGENPDPTDPKKDRRYDPQQYTWERLGYSNHDEFAEDHWRKKEEVGRAMEGFTFDKDTQYYKKGDREDSYMSKSDAEMLLKFLQEEGSLYVDSDAHGLADSYEHGLAFYKASGIFKTNDGDWRISFDWYTLDRDTGDIVKWKTNVEDYDDGSAYSVWELTPLTEKENVFASRRLAKEKERASQDYNKVKGKTNPNQGDPRAAFRNLQNEDPYGGY